MKLILITLSLFFSISAIADQQQEIAANTAHFLVRTYAKKAAEVCTNRKHSLVSSELVFEDNSEACIEFRRLVSEISYFDITVTNQRSLPIVDENEIDEVDLENHPWLRNLRKR